MKVKYFKSNLGKVFDPNKDFTTDIPIILMRHPVEPREGASVGYVQQKLEEFYKNPVINGTIDNTDILQVRGSEITHERNSINLHEIIERGAATSVEVNNKGLVVKSYPLSQATISDKSKISYSIIGNQPSTIDGYGIKNLASSRKLEDISGYMTTDKFPRHTKGPVPFGHLMVIWDESGYELNVGDILFKFSPGPRAEWIEARGGYVLKSEAPHLVRHLTGSSTAERANLPDCTIRDNYLLNSYGVAGKSYIKVMPAGIQGSKVVNVYRD